MDCCGSKKDDTIEDKKNDETGNHMADPNHCSNAMMGTGKKILA